MTVHLHGPELDRAIDAVGDPHEMAEAYGPCLTALETRTSTFIDTQIENADQPLDAVRADMAAEGLDPSDLSDDEVAALVVRSIIGGSFTFGLGVGLALAGIAQERALGNGAA